jgi:hypothetical protein
VFRIGDRAHETKDDTEIMPKGIPFVLVVLFGISEAAGKDRGF